ncbi:glycosyltransferase [Gracilibacillus phocaeensis]|uniref:glycosyltransferase n=1 Tax=Gracilibacillus phocaeensis TaxID=2042304 RepID=UPI0010312283|nr:glycosyltransferase [Gracilibacillus phocaeensis]
MKPIISVIVPVYNLEAYMAKCLDSILAQAFTSMEMVVVNDGSTDGSGAICDQFSSKDNRVKVIHQEHAGVSAARNAGVAAATGEYIGFVDADDYIEKDMYQRLYQLCEETGCAISVCDLGREIDGKRIDSRNGPPYQKVMTNQEAMSELFKGRLFRFSLCNKLFKKSCFTGVSFPVGRIHEDLSTTYKLFANAETVTYSNFAGYVYVKRSHSILNERFHQGRLDAFIAWNDILEFIEQYDSSLLTDVYACYGYWCVDNIFYVLNQTMNRREKKLYLLKIRRYSRKHYRKMMRNNILSYKYKYIVSMIRYNIFLLLFSSRLKQTLGLS